MSDSQTGFQTSFLSYFIDWPIKDVVVVERVTMHLPFSAFNCWLIISVHIPFTAILYFVCITIYTQLYPVRCASMALSSNSFPPWSRLLIQLCSISLNFYLHGTPDPIIPPPSPPAPFTNTLTHSRRQRSCVSQTQYSLLPYLLITPSLPQLLPACRGWSFNIWCLVP